MKIICIIATLVLAQSAFAGPTVVYGQDDRRDVFQTSSALHLKLAKSSAGLIKKSMFVKGASATSFDLKNTVSLERSQNICATEKFSQQPTAPICSGFLVGPDTLITAGHCYNAFDTPANVCKDFAWVFDYDMKSATHNPTKNISIANIYNCKSVSSVVRDGLYDYAVIKLDRKVVGREPLKFRTTGKLANTASLVVIGHPTGLPTKITANGKVTNNTEETRFSTTLDTFHGNSGSAVFDATTGQVEGILIMGKNDYRPSLMSNPGSCKVVNKCDETAKNCSAGDETGTIQHGEVVLRIEKISAQIAKALATKK
ncbi:MAG: trypsin-like peptidase domain-containing protein [Bdellovibrionales bacterium]|nr:trypsin-like peptidase domain-containing protein [Bdellovibrionales bacterium]